VLLLLPVLQEVQRAHLAPLPLNARLARPEPAAPVVLPKDPTPPPQLPARKSLPGPVAKASPQPAREHAPAEPVPEAAPAKQATATTPVVPETPPPLQAVAPKLPVASGPDPGSVAQFRLELMDLARRHKKYPRIAQDNNWEGRVELRVAVAENGAISSITVKRSAGRTVLDDEAQAMVRRAGANATIPPALRGKAFVLEFPVDFLLKDEER
jgi:protein TonB